MQKKYIQEINSFLKEEKPLLRCSSGKSLIIPECSQLSGS